MDFEEAFRILDTAVFNHINRRLKPREIIVLRGSWQGLTYEQIANDSGYTEGFLRQDVGFHLWRLLSEVLKEEVSKTNFRGVVERLYRNQNISIGECPQSPLSAKSPFYVERTPIERHCYAEILRPGALIRIQAPRQMGKTSLLNRIIAHANQQGYYTVNLNFLRAEISIFTNLDKFLRWLCSYVSDRLRLELFLNQTWDEYRGSIVNCRTYFQDHILEKIDNNLVLAIDEADTIFQYPEISQGFFGMLRSWHEDAKVYEVWEKLRLIVVQSIEDYDSSYIDRSPFGNVGSVFKLPEFTEAQVQDLAERYKLNYDQTQVQQLMSLIGGHPYLIRLAIDHLTDGETLENFLNNAPTNDGIYGDYLRRIFSKLQRSPHLSTAFKQVVTATEPVAIPTNTEYQLYSMGLVERAKKGNKFIPRCQLYRQYFQEHL